MSEAADRKASKLSAISAYTADAATALVNDDEYGWRQAMEELMSVVGSEVEVYGGVVPTTGANPNRPYQWPGGCRRCGDEDHGLDYCSDCTNYGGECAMPRPVETDA